MGSTFTSWHRAQASIAQQTLTNSKHPRTHIRPHYPTHVHSGHGCVLRTHDGKEYVDFICGLGTNLLGYGEPRVARAAYQAGLGGWSHSFPTHWELNCAEKLKEFFPFIDRVKFLKSGSEACSAALRIARTRTGKKYVLSEGYHGWHDEFVSLTEPAAGVAGEYYIDHLRSLEQIGKHSDLAAVIVEPFITDDSKERIEWLHELRRVCSASGVMLIFDEIITGFRYEKYGVSNCYGVVPDILCLGKAIANGMPLAAVCGKEAWMDDPSYFVSSTYASEVSSLAAALEAMTILQRDPDYDIKNLVLDGKDFICRFNELGRGELRIKGYPTRGVFEGPQNLKALFFQECSKLGILFGPSWFYNFPLMRQKNRVLIDCKIVLEKIFSGKVEFDGELPESPFAQGVRNGR